MSDRPRSRRDFLIMDPADRTDRFYRHRNVVARVGQKLGGEVGTDRLVEHVRSDALQNVRIAVLENTNVDHGMAARTSSGSGRFV